MICHDYIVYTATYLGDLMANNVVTTTEAQDPAYTTFQVSVGTSATKILSADTERAAAICICASTWYVGQSGVTTSTGLLVPANVGMVLGTGGAYYGVASGAVTVTVMTETKP